MNKKKKVTNKIVITITMVSIFYIIGIGSSILLIDDFSTSIVENILLVIACAWNMIFAYANKIED